MKKKDSYKLILKTIIIFLLLLSCKSQSNDEIVSSHQVKRELSTCIKVFIEVYTKISLKRYSWRINDATSHELLEKNAAFTSRNTWNRKTIACLQKEGAPYEIILNSEEGDGFLWGGRYRLSINNMLVKEVPGRHQFNKIITTICTLDSHCDDGLDCTEDTCNPLSNVCEHVLKQNESCKRGVGEHSTLVILVRGDDTVPSIDQEDIMTHVFGGNTGDKYSMKTQFAHCSQDVFKIIPFHGSTLTGKSVFNGVNEYHIQRNIVGDQVGLIATEVFDKINEIYGDLERQFDFLLICLPPGLMLGATDRWKAYAFIDSFKSVYNDKNCIYPSVLMHELGHNLGLSHSNDARTYGDETGMMGISYNSTEKPMKCFNPPKLWHTAWYHHSHLIVDVNRNLGLWKTKEFSLFSIVDASYYKSKFGNTIIKLINLGKGYDYYLTFNRQVDFNNDTKEGMNQVIVTKREVGGAYSDSFLMASVIFGHSFYITEMQDDHRIYVRANMNIDRNLFYNIRPYAIIKLTKYGSQEEGEGVCIKKNKLELLVDVQTHISPQYLYWTLTDINTRKVVQSSHSFEKENEVYSVRVCVDVGEYAFLFAQTHNHSLSYDDESYEPNYDHAYFVLSLNDYIIDWDAVSEETYIENRFTVCEDDIQCFDYDGCTIDYCNNTLNLCENIYVEDYEEYGNNECSSCTWFELNVTPDNYPEETKWSLAHVESNRLILFGEPYSFGGDDDYVESGRRKAPTKSGRRKAPTRLGRRKAPTKNGRRKAPTKSGRRKAPTKSGRRKAPTRVSAHYHDSTHYFQYPSYYSRRLVGNEQDEDELISERICLNNYHTYQFIITDQFGDGICCAEGEGFYEIEIQNELIRHNGAYGDGEDLSFTPGSCISSSDCDDNDPCTTDECSVSISTCFYTKKPCSECGGNVKVMIRTDSFPEGKSWNIYKNSEQIQTGGPFYVAKHSYEYDYCLTFGSYEFEMNSHSGFMECSGFQQVKCGYQILVNGERVIESGNEYYKKEIHAFGICQSDADCNDGDDCTHDRCDMQTHSCIFQRDCALCSKALVVVGVKTNVNRLEWKVFPKNNNGAVNQELMRSGVYNRHFIMDDHATAKCLPGGEYELLYKSLQFEGCHLQNHCSYNVTVSNQLIFQVEYEEISKKTSFFKVPYYCNIDNDCSTDTCIHGICENNYCKCWET